MIKVMLWTSAAFFAAITILFAITQTMKSGAGMTSPSPTVPENIQEFDSGVRVLDDDAFDGPEVRFDGERFAPGEVNASAAEHQQTGCVVKFMNSSKTPLTIRLGPYKKGVKPKGFLYPVIPPGGFSIIDPRYGMLTTVMFYSAEIPSASVTIHIDPTCIR